jgi:undecaprenyl-diphosphatase
MSSRSDARGRAAAADEPPARLTLGLALSVGAIHGAAELLPISSSGHVTLLPWLVGRDLTRSEPELRKAFEVALHAGTAVALLLARRDEIAELMDGLSTRRLAVLTLATAPAAAAGLVLERPIERRLGTPATIAVGLAAGALALAAADRAPQERRWVDAGPTDGLWIGVAQAVALLPGVSRNGATLVAARARRFARPDANRLSRQAALPVIAGASALKLLRLAVGQTSGPDRGRGAAAPLWIGAGASFLSTLAAGRLIDEVDRDRSLLPFVVYRLTLAGLVAARLRRTMYDNERVPHPDRQP